MSLIYTAPRASCSGTKAHGLYIGGKKDAKSRSSLERWGITHILNVTPEKDSSIQAGVPNYFEKDAGSSKRIIYRRVSVYDTATSDLLSHADSVVGFISSGLHHGSVLVHCKEGVSRSTTCVIFFLMRKFGMTFDKAMALCVQKRPDVHPIPAFIEQCKNYEGKCRKLGVIRNEMTSKKRKAAGPSIGPSIGPSSDPNTEKERTSKKRIIGPAGPPLAGAEEDKAEEKPLSRPVGQQMKK